VELQGELTNKPGDRCSEQSAAKHNAKKSGDLVLSVGA